MEERKAKKSNIDLSVIDSPSIESQPEKEDVNKFEFHEQEFESSLNLNQEVLKRENESSETQPTKKFKLNDTEAKDLKMLHQENGQTKVFGWKENNLHQNKIKTMQQSHILYEQIGQVHTPNHHKLKMFGEELRRRDCKADRRSELVREIHAYIKGHARKFAYDFHTVRVLECFFGLCEELHKILLFAELQSDILPLTKSQYGRFLVIKMLKCGTKFQKETIIKTFSENLVSLMQDENAVGVVEVAFSECLNSTEKREFILQFYGLDVTNSGVQILEELLQKSPEEAKPDMLKALENKLLKIINKSSVKHSIVHCVLLEFMENVDAISKAKIIKDLTESIPDLVYSKEGSRVAMQCIWFSNEQVHKAIIMKLKNFISKIAMKEFGHMVLLALLDSVDDTEFLINHVLQELLTNLNQVALNAHGRKVLVYLLNHRDPQYFSPSIVDILKKGDNNGISTKDPKVRQEELKSAVSGPLLEFVKSKIRNHHAFNWFCLLACTVLKHAIGEKKHIFEAIAELCTKPYSTENKSHIIESSGCHQLFKMLIDMDKNLGQKECKFSNTLLNIVPRLVPKSWIGCNRGTILLASLLETKIPSVVQRIKNELKNCKASLMKKDFEGAKKLKEKLNM